MATDSAITIIMPRAIENIAVHRMSSRRLSAGPLTEPPGRVRPEYTRTTAPSVAKPPARPAIRAAAIGAPVMPTDAAPNSPAPNAASVAKKMSRLAATARKWNCRGVLWVPGWPARLATRMPIAAPKPPMIPTLGLPESLAANQKATALTAATKYTPPQCSLMYAAKRTVKKIDVAISAALVQAVVATPINRSAAVVTMTARNRRREKLPTAKGNSHHARFGVP